MQQPRGVSWTPEADNTGLPQSSHHLPPLQPAPSPTLQPPAPQNSIIPPPGLCLRNAGFESCPTPSTRAPGLCPARSPHSRPPPQHGGGRLPSRHLSSPHLTSHPAAPQSPTARGPGSLNPHPAAAAGWRPAGGEHTAPAQPCPAPAGSAWGKRRPPAQGRPHPEGGAAAAAPLLHTRGPAPGRGLRGRGRERGRSRARCQRAAVGCPHGRAGRRRTSARQHLQGGQVNLLRARARGCPPKGNGAGD